jgi:ABC-type transport system substrate-binding protein
MLTNVPDPNRIDLLLGFACRARAGDYGGNGHKVQAGTIQVALRSIGATFELEGLPNTTYRSTGKYWVAIQRRLTLIKSAVSLLGLDKKGFPPDKVSSVFKFLF